MSSSIDAVRRRLLRLRALEGLESELASAVDDDALPDIRTYPPELPGQRYVRTYRLRESWKRGAVQRLGRALRVVVRSEIGYARWVVGDRTQAPIHQGRWRTQSELRASIEPRIRARLARALKRMAG